jgi:hypothetical protein
MINHSRLLVALVIASLTLSDPALAQIRASEIGTISQIIDGTKISMQYSRPRVRGRDPLWGTRAVHWGEVWTPGANWATTLEVDKDIKLDGHPVAKGKYSVWMVVRQSGEWTMVLDPKWKLYHMTPPDSNTNQVRFPIHPKDAPFADVLTWSMPDIRANGGTLAFNWAKTVVAMDLEVQPSLQMTLAESDAKPYLGRYDCVEKDSSGKETKKVFIVDYENGTLKGAWDPADPYFQHFALIRIAPDWFVPGIYDSKGVVYEVLRPDVVIEFTRKNGRAMSFEMRDEDDKAFASGTRKP